MKDNRHHKGDEHSMFICKQTNIMDFHLDWNFNIHLMIYDAFDFSNICSVEIHLLHDPYEKPSSWLLMNDFRLIFRLQINNNWSRQSTLGS